MKITVTKLGDSSLVKLRCTRVPPRDFREVLKGRGWRWKKPSDGEGYWLGERKWVPEEDIARREWELSVDGKIIPYMFHVSGTATNPDPTPDPPKQEPITAVSTSPVPEPTREKQEARVFRYPSFVSQRPLRRNFRITDPDGKEWNVLDWVRKLDYPRLRRVCTHFSVKHYTTRAKSEIILEPENLAAALASEMVEAFNRGATQSKQVLDWMKTPPEDVPPLSIRLKDSTLPASMQIEAAWREFIEQGGKVNTQVEISPEQLRNEVNIQVEQRASEVYGLMETAVQDAAADVWDPGTVRKQVEEAVAKAAENARPVVHQIVSPKKTTNLPAGVTLPAEFDKILRNASLGIPTMMVGPTGCGKTFIASQVAKALELDFAAISCSIGAPDSALTGLLLPTGANGKFVYVPSEFVRMYENGGVMCIDEMDNADANWLVLFNMALSGTDGFYLPQRYEKPFVKRHENFVCIAAANTFGTGADLQYVGRSQLDEATLDRFRVGTVFMDYDPKVEESLIDPEILTWGRKLRERIRENKLRRTLSTRVMRDFTELKRAYPDDWSLKGAEDTFMVSWKEDERRKVAVA